MVFRILAVAACLSTVNGCGTGSTEGPDYGLADEASVWITVATGPHAAGAPVQLAVHNRGDVSYVWNPCMRTLERRTDAGWTAVNERDRGVYGRGLAAGA